MMPRAQIHACALLIGAMLLHKLQNSGEKKGKDDGLRNWEKKFVWCIKHLVERIS
jgi:hypothetical protein